MVEADLFGMGMQKAKPVCIHITVRANLFPCFDGGSNCQITSMEINLIGAGLAS